MKKILQKIGMLIAVLLWSLACMASDFESEGAFYTVTSMNDLEVTLDSVKFTTDIFTLTDKVTFNNRNLKVTNVREEAFKKAVGLRELAINTMLELPEGLLRNLKNLEKLNIQSNIETIPADFCNGCIGLSELILPKSVKNLNSGCFNGCENLSYFSTIPAHVNLIEKNAIKNTHINLNDMIIEDGSEILVIQDWSSNDIYPIALYLGRNIQSSDSENVNMGRNIQSISYSSDINTLPKGFFRNNISISTISLPDLLVKIPDSCFDGCKNLDNIIIPSYVTEIGANAFRNTSLISFPDCSGITTIGDNAFYNSKIETLKFNCPVEYIGNDAFNCVTNAKLPPSLKNIEANTFSSLKTLIIEESKDTLWLGNETLSTSLISKGSGPRFDQSAAQASPYVCARYLKNLSSYNIENLIIGRPVAGKKSIYRHGKYDEPANIDGYSYLYEYTTVYFNYPSVVNPHVKRLTLSSVYRTSKLDVSPDSITVTTYDHTTSYLSNEYEYIDTSILNYSDVLIPSVCESLEEINVLSSNPPALNEDFPNAVYLNAVLRVPIGSKKNYENADYWKGFWNIEEVDFSNENIWDLPISPQGISINASEARLKLSETIQLEVIPIPEEASLDPIRWTSSDDAVAIVNEEGLVFALSEGTATITATMGDFTATCKVTVYNPIIEAEQVVLNVEAAQLNIGETVQLEATVLPEDATDKTIEWQSSDDEIAVVNEAGLVTAVKEGSAIITATCGEASAQCQVTVLEENGVEGILANPNREITIYSVDGTLVKKDCKVEALKTLEKGIYIIVSGKDRYKITL